MDILSYIFLYCPEVSPVGWEEDAAEEDSAWLALEESELSSVSSVSLEPKKY